jgi:hypothetical protein
MPFPSLISRNSPKQLGMVSPELLHAKTLEAIADRLGVRPEEIEGY